MPCMLDLPSVGRLDHTVCFGLAGPCLSILPEWNLYLSVLEDGAVVNVDVQSLNHVLQ